MKIGDKVRPKNWTPPIGEVIAIDLVGRPVVKWEHVEATAAVDHPEELEVLED